MDAKYVTKENNTYLFTAQKLLFQKAKDIIREQCLKMLIFNYPRQVFMLQNPKTQNVLKLKHCFKHIYRLQNVLEWLFLLTQGKNCSPTEVHVCSRHQQVHSQQFP